jgi:hypothetical protein
MHATLSQASLSSGKDVRCSLMGGLIVEGETCRVAAFRGAALFSGEVGTPSMHEPCITSLSCVPRDVRRPSLGGGSIVKGETCGVDVFRGAALFSGDIGTPSMPGSCITSLSSVPRDVKSPSLGVGSYSDR